MLSLHQEMLLLAVNDDGDIEFTAGTSTFRLALVGACLIELALKDKIEVDPEEVRVISRDTEDDGTLNLVIERLCEHNTPQRLRFWLSHLQEDFQEITRLTLKSLCDQGILKSEESRFLWVLSSRKYPVVDGTEKKEAKLRIMETLLGDSIPSPEDSVLIGLARVGGLLEAFLSTTEIARLEGRLEQVSNLDLTAGLVELAIQEEQEAIARAMLASPYPI
jgi:Golgi phosphoprotein 3